MVRELAKDNDPYREIKRQFTLFALKLLPGMETVVRESQDPIGTAVRLAGLDTMVRVIDNGTDIPGTDIQNGSDALKKKFKKTDLIISKGQGNYETLTTITKNIFFILKAKCPVVAKDLGCGVGSMILTRSNSYG
ncbi:ARMT1-like domain-containing protein [uncultured Desulfobacter sp.]|uniref:ARMT1-like domain-containing protein n=1 Tax=uncultured Desulfobacter sp. TaxID=240139 RepID=UPI002AAB908A|nr:ARMT1-like domain-containing protein [uncultured Desulfobacter sp.]